MFSLLPIKLFAGYKVLTRTARMFLEQVFKNWLVSFRVETHWRWSIRIFWIFSLYNKNGSSFEKLISSCVFLTLLCTYFEAYFKLQLSPLPFRFEAVFPPCEVLRLEDLCSCPWEFWQGCCSPGTKGKYAEMHLRHWKHDLLLLFLTGIPMMVAVLSSPTSVKREALFFVTVTSHCKDGY